jgi:hypothetical protein
VATWRNSPRLRVWMRELFGRAAIVGMTQQMIGEVKGQCRLADAYRAGEDKGMRQLARAIGRGQHRGRLFMAEQARVFGRLGNAVERVVLFGGDPFEHQASALARLPAVARASRAAKTASVIWCSTSS